MTQIISNQRLTLNLAQAAKDSKRAGSVAALQHFTKELGAVVFQVTGGAAQLNANGLSLVMELKGLDLNLETSIKLEKYFSDIIATSSQRNVKSAYSHSEESLVFNVE